MTMKIPTKLTGFIAAVAVFATQAFAHSGRTVEGTSCHTGSPSSEQPGWHCNHGDEDSGTDWKLLGGLLLLGIVVSAANNRSGFGSTKGSIEVDSNYLDWAERSWQTYPH